MKIHKVEERLRSSRIVIFWLWCVLLTIAMMVMVGGATRLTDSGLSITEWKPVTGFLPPLSSKEWKNEFDKYQKIPQFKLENNLMELDDFKTIYWWEWSHRNLGRFGGFLILPLLAFIALGKVRNPLIWRYLLIFGVGGLQGLVGWYMVSSGLSVRTDVSHYRLALHLSIATIMFMLVAMELNLAKKKFTSRRQKSIPYVTALFIFSLILLVLQIILGALVAGLDAGLVASDWPLINGSFFPVEFLQISNSWSLLFEHPVLVQFLHRNVGYLLYAVVLVIVIKTAYFNKNCLKNKEFLYAFAIFFLLTLQILLGVIILYYQVPIFIALFHQLNAFVILYVLVSAIVHQCLILNN